MSGTVFCPLIFLSDLLSDKKLSGLKMNSGQVLFEQRFGFAMKLKQFCLQIEAHGGAR